MNRWRKYRSTLGVVLLLAACVMGFSSPADAGEQILNVQGYGVGNTIGGGACGIEVSPNDYPLCGAFGPNFVVQRVSGTGYWQHVGNFDWVADFIFDATAGTPTPMRDVAGNPTLGLCYKAYGEAVHTATNGVITMSVTVDLCTSGADIVFNGAYNVTGGTDRFEDAAGFGSIAGGLDAYGKMLVNVDGTLVPGEDVD